jgi:hypothetical protein
LVFDERSVHSQVVEKHFGEIPHNCPQKRALAEAEGPETTAIAQLLITNWVIVQKPGLA